MIFIFSLSGLIWLNHEIRKGIRSIIGNERWRLHFNAEIQLFTGSCSCCDFLIRKKKKKENFSRWLGTAAAVNKSDVIHFYKYRIDIRDVKCRKRKRYRQKVFFTRPRYYYYFFDYHFSLSGMIMNFLYFSVRAKWRKRFAFVSRKKKKKKISRRMNV